MQQNRASSRPATASEQHIYTAITVPYFTLSFQLGNAVQYIQNQWSTMTEEALEVSIAIRLVAALALPPCRPRPWCSQALSSCAKDSCVPLLCFVGLVGSWGRGTSSALPFPCSFSKPLEEKKTQIYSWHAACTKFLTRVLVIQYAHSELKTNGFSANFGVH